MNKKGFIATSLLYSFFLLFCALILVFVGNMAHKSLLFNKEIDQINKDLHSIIYLKDAKIGSYFRLNICISEDKKDYFNQADTLDYIIFDNSSGGNALFVSKNYSFKLNSLELLDNILNSIYVKNGLYRINSRSMTINDYNEKISQLSDEKVRELLIYSDFDFDSMYLLAADKNTYTSSKVIEINENIDKNTNPETQDLKDNDISKEKVFVRLVFEINNSTMIIGGDGTSSNPHILKGGAASC